MSMHRTKATFIGLLESGRANEWIVTEKLGDALKNKQLDSSKNKSNAKLPKLRLSFRIRNRIHPLELGFGVFLFICGCYDFVHGKNYFIYLFLQNFSFFITGFGYIGMIIEAI